MMRLALACLMLLPGAALADSFTLQSTPTTVTVYADAGKVTREMTLQVPAGQHDVLLPGLPRNLAPDLLRVSVSGARLGATQFRSDAVMPQPEADHAALQAAKDRIKAAEDALQDLDDQIAEAQLAGRAAEATSDFLSDLGKNQGLPTDVATLRGLAQMVGAETLVAEQAALASLRAVRDLNAGRKDLQQELQDAKAALAALTPPQEETAQLTLSLNAQEAGEVAISLSYIVEASWWPVYDIYLSGDVVNLHRGAMVRQWSDEIWPDVDLTLSTFSLDTQTAPREVFPIPLYIGDEVQASSKVLGRVASADMSAPAEPAMEAPVIMEESAQASFDGPGVAYHVPNPVLIASNVDAVRVGLGTLDFDARRFARAAPRYDSTAFLMAGFTNTTQEPLLASREAALYLDDTLIGRTGFEPVPAGAEAELAFGPVEDIRLSYTVLRESEGDRGIINRSNAKSETTRMDIQNIGSTDWDVQVQAAVPYSVQEDLVITWSATPTPDSQNIKDKRGVLQWDTPVPAGTTTSIQIETDLKWPEGKVLR